MRKRKPWMDAAQMKYMYATAANPKRQVGILAELNEVDEDTIREVIGIKPKTANVINAVPERPGSGRKRHLAPDVVYTICELYREGHSYREIAELLKKNYMTVYNVVQREIYGISNSKKKSRHGAATP